jgi:hypothetical protein
MSRLIKRIALVLSVSALSAVAACSSVLGPEPAPGVPLEEWEPGEGAESGTPCLPSDAERDLCPI